MTDDELQEYAIGAILWIGQQIGMAKIAKIAQRTLGADLTETADPLPILEQFERHEHLFSEPTRRAVRKHIAEALAE